MIAPTSDCSNKMRYFKQLAATVLAALMILPPAPLLAGTKKGDKLRNQARTEELKGNLQKAFDLTSQAVAEDPGDPSYNLQLHRLRFELGVQHVQTGQKLRDAGKLPEALAEFEKGYGIDPASDVAAQEIRRTHEMMDREKDGGAKDGALKKEDTSSLTPSAFAKKQQQDRTDALMSVPVLRPLSTDLIDLKMTNKPRTLFETLGKVAGINVTFDPDYNTQQTMTQPVQIDLSRTTVESALDQLSLQTKSFWKPLTPNTIFVSIDNRNNRTQFTDQVVKIFYLSNTTTAQEIQEILTVLRTVVDVQKVFNYSAQNALVVRCDADVMALVEKLISDLDKPRAEVLVDVLVMQVSSTYIRNLGAGLANGINATASFQPRPGITTPGVQAASTATSSTTTATTATTTTPTTSSGSGSSIPFSELGHISSADYSISNLPGAQFEAMLTDSSTRVLQAPQIRAADNTKASINIGDKIPIATGSFQSAVGAVGALPAANTQFSFQDVGVNVEITPQIHDNNEISLAVTLDVSAVKDRIDVGGVSQPEITQNKLTANIRLREGEVNLIGGLITDSVSKALTGFPGLAHIPLLGRLFSNEDYEKDKEELVIALIPHIVRGKDITATNLKGVASGSQSQIKVSYDTARFANAANAPSPVAPAAGSLPATAPATAPVGGVLSTSPNAAGAAPVPSASGAAIQSGSLPGVPAIPVVPRPPANVLPATAPPASAPPATAPPATAPPLGIRGMNAPPMAAPAPPVGGPARIALQPSTSTAKLNAAVTMTVYAENVVNLADVAAQLQYNPKILRVTNITLGDLPGRNLAPPELTKNVLDDVGRADMRVSRGSNGGTISGSGSLFTIVFQAIGTGNSAVTLSSFALRNADGPAAASTPSPASVIVQ